MYNADTTKVVLRRSTFSVSRSEAKNVPIAVDRNEWVNHPFVSIKIQNHSE